MTALSPRAELAKAIRDLNARFHKLPPEQRPEVGWGELDERLEAALASDEPERALDEVERWHGEHLVAFEEARTAQEVTP
jgi:hypothetical protein